MIERFLSLRSFDYDRLRFSLSLKERTVFPKFKGAILRGIFGFALRRKFCVRQKSLRCFGCAHHADCPYGYLFETPNFKSRSSYVSQTSAVPQPFVLEPPLEQKTIFQRGDELDFCFVLIGNARRYLPSVISSFQEAGELGLSSQGVRLNFIVEKISEDKKAAIPFLTRPRESDDRTKSRIGFHFLTPTRIKEEKALVTHPQFRHILKSLLIRMDLLADFHCGIHLDINLDSCLRDSAEIHVVKDDLTWQDDFSHKSARTRSEGQRTRTEVILGGFCGKIVFEGDFQDLLPLLYLGQDLHIGNSASFGLGKYKIIGT